MVKETLDSVTAGLAIFATILAVLMALGSDTLTTIGSTQSSPDQMRNFFLICAGVFALAYRYYR